MSKKSKNQWYYVWTSGCGPCTRVSPTIDAMIACGLNIVKVTLKDYNEKYKGQDPVRGTPSIFEVDENGKTVQILQSAIISPLIELSNNAPEILKQNAAEYLREKIGMK